MGKMKDRAPSTNEPVLNNNPPCNNLEQYDQTCEKVHQLATQFKQAKKKKHFQQADAL
jgi:hypothetical protein